MSKRFDPALIPDFPNLQYEAECWQRGELAAGLDEAGRGALAGPLYAAAVILPCGWKELEKELFGVRDSKQLTYLEREHWAPIIRRVAQDWAIAWVQNEEIDQIGMARAGVLVFERALAGLKSQPSQLLLDYFDLPRCKIPQINLIKGDQRSLSIACASVLAKQARDQHMLELSDQYPVYEFGQNKGYGTPGHLRAIEKFGLCPLHRRSFCEHLLQQKLFD